MPLYAAYGSNMHPEQMLQRAPHSPMAGTGWLHGWRLTFGGEDIGWEGGLPSARYIGVMADAAEIAGAPDEYVHNLRTREARNIGPGT